MKRIIINILAIFGVVFICLLLALAYFVVTDPFNLKPIFFGTATSSLKNVETENEVTEADEDSVNAATETENTSTTESNSAPDRVEFTLSADQRQALINLGVSPESIPTSLSYEQEKCFVSVLGEARVLEIKAGAVPGPLEFIRAQACI